MRFAMVGPIYPYRGGIAHYTTMLFQKIRERGHEISLYSFRRMYPAWLFPGKTDQDPTKKIANLPCSFSLDSLDPRTWVNTGLMIRAGCPEALILHWWVPFFAPIWGSLAWLCQRAGMKVVFICHNVLPHERRPLDVPLTRLAFHFADAFILASSEQHDKLVSLMGERKTARIAHHPLNYLLAQNTCSQASARQRLGLGEDGQVLLFFGFVRKYKGLGSLLNALSLIRTRLPKVHLLIVGEFWEDRKAYEAQIHRLQLKGHLTIIDRYVPDDEVALYFAAADATVLPYTQVTQSAVLQLSFAFGVPVIASNLGALAEAIESNGTGLLAVPGDQHSLAEAVINFFANSMALKMRERLRQTFDDSSWTCLIETIESISR